MKDLTIAFMVAGISSRFGGRAKAFAKVGPKGETLIEYSIDRAISAGFKKIALIVGNSTESLFKEKFGRSYKDIPIEYAKQEFSTTDRDKPWGTVDAVCSAINILTSPFAICNGDDIYSEEEFKTLINHLKNSDKEATIGYKLLEVIPDKGKTNRGIFRYNEKKELTDIKETFNIEKEDLSSSGVKENDLCSMNLFALHPPTLKLLNEKLIKFKEAHKGDRKAECLLPEEISNLIKEGKITMLLYEAKGKWLGVTNPEDELIVREALSKQNNF